MGQSSQLEELLRAELEGGVKDSSGTFTIAREQALEKLAAFLLPSENAWVLKIVQAAVASGCTELDIRQTISGTEFHFGQFPGWALEAVEREFYQVETSLDPGLQHLKQGLWSVALNGMRPFSLVAPGWSHSLFWTGEQMLRKAPVSATRTVLTISHRTIMQGSTFKLLQAIEAASRNAEVARELSLHAFTCCIPLRLDGRRLDALQLSPLHGFSSTSYPMQLGFIQADLPSLALPPATFGNFQAPNDIDSAMQKLFDRSQSLPQSIGLACLASAHLQKVTENKSTFWKLREEESLVYWIRDGVVVDRSRPKFRTGACSVAIFASAEGLSPDATGFILQRTPPLQERLELICRLATPFVCEVELASGKVVQAARGTAKLWGGLLAASAIPLSFVSPVYGFGAAAIGLAGIVTGGQPEIQILKQLEVGLAELQCAWRERFS